MTGAAGALRASLTRAASGAIDARFVGTSVAAIFPLVALGLDPRAHPFRN